MTPTMISVNEAQSMIAESMPEMPLAMMNIDHCLDEVIGEDIYADRDLPPYDRVAMDGIAVAYANIEQGQNRLPIIGLQRAGDPAQDISGQRGCIEVMTGSILPIGCDTIVPYEQIRIEEGYAYLETLNFEKFQNIHRQASDQAKNELVLSTGSTLYSAELAIAAAVGKSQLRVFQRPSIALVSTGDELVDIDKIPDQHQIRRSNEYAIASSLKAHGFTQIVKAHCPDQEDLMAATISRLLQEHDVLIFSGGVSAGKFDLLPKVLGNLGVQPIFHKIRQRPGKPMFFGVHPKNSNRPIFGLPGNPVSALIVFHRFVLPALQQSIGKRPGGKQQVFAKLSHDITFNKPMTLFRPVRVLPKESGEIWVELLASNGSGDFISLRGSDGFVELAAEKELFPCGSAVPLWTWR